MYAVHILALLTVSALASVVADPGQQLDALCNWKHGSELEISKLSDVQAIISLLKAEPSFECPDKVRDPILALEPLIQLHSVCSEEAADQIVDYWAKYLNKRIGRKSKLPRPLKKFFVAFGLQVSKVCKRTLIEELKNAAEQSGISQKDVDLVTRPTKEAKQVMALFGPEPALESLLIVVRVDSPKTNAANFHEGNRKKINMPPKEARYFELVQERCLHKFKPVYDSLILPLVRLSAIGLDYKGEDEAMEAFKRDSVYLDWFTAVVSCIPVLKHDAVSIPLQRLTGDSNVATITYLEEEDIADLKEKTGLEIVEPTLRESVDYKVEARVGDLVVDASDQHLIGALAKYGKGLNRAMKLKLALAKKMPKLVKSLLKNKEVRFGLKPAEKLGGQSLSRFGFDGSPKTRRIGSAVLVSFLLLAVFGGIFGGPLAPMFISVGIVFFMFTLVVMLAITKIQHDPPLYVW